MEITMNLENHTKQVEYIFNIVTEKTTGSKHKEYANADNVFINFQEGAKINGSNQITTAWNFATKHLVSFMDIIKNPLKFAMPVIDEKATDLIAYIVIIRNMILEKQYAEKVKVDCNE